MKRRKTLLLLLFIVSSCGRDSIFNFRKTQLLFSAHPTDAIIGDTIGPSIRVEVRNGAGRVVTSSNDTITLALSSTGNPFPGIATLSGTLSAQAVNGVAVFDDLNIDQENEGYRLSATAPGLSSATSASFNIYSKTPIFRSVGPGNTAAIATSSSGGTLTVLGTTATFSLDSLDSNIGVGDVIQYDSNDDGSIDSVTFIHGRSQSNVFHVRAANGGMAIATVSPDSDWSIFRAYTSLSNAEVGIENTGLDDGIENFDTWVGGADISAGGLDVVWNIACYADGTDSSTTFDGWTTDSDNYLRIFTPKKSNEVGSSQRHSGLWDASKYHITAAANSGIYFNGVHYGRIEGIQSQIDANTSWNGSSFRLTDITGASDIRISHSIGRQINKAEEIGWHSGIVVYGTVTTAVLRAWNNIFYDYDGNGVSYHTGIYFGGATAYLYNNTFNNCYAGHMLDAGNSVVANSIAQNVTVGYGTSGGTYDAASTSNISDIGDSPGLLPINGSVIFQNSGANDYRLSSSDSVAKGQGVDMSSDGNLSFLDDIISALRGASWDVGASQVSY